MSQDLTRMYSLVNGILGFVRGAGQEMEIGEVERRLLGMVMEVGREALIEFVEAKGSGYQGRELVNGQGVCLAYVRDRSCAYRSVFGKIDVSRAYYQAKGEDGVFPLDGMLNLPDRGYSYLMQEIASKLAMNASYEKACEVFTDIFPIDLPIRSLERVVGETCEGRRAVGLQCIVCVTADRYSSICCNGESLVYGSKCCLVVLFVI